jgi:DNA-binding NarL/FixJ family response regulator
VLFGDHGFDVVGHYGTPVELTAQVSELQPDPVIVDIRMPPTHTTGGLDAAARSTTSSPNRNPADLACSESWACPTGCPATGADDGATG